MREKLFFLLHDGDLILQARRPEDPPSRLLQLVPRTVFVGDFPNSFVDDHVHWLDLGTGEIEFRPVETPWTPDLRNWRLFRTDGVPFLLRKISGHNATPMDLIDIRSPTFQMISRSLSALESPEHMIITRTNQALEASLDRLRLTFFVNQNSQLECRGMPGYVIDEFQSCGTMIGLNNKLVLRPSNGSSEMPRRVIIPQGSTELRLDGDFANVSVKTGTAQNVDWHEYTIDTALGRLTSNASLQSKLYQCYLHAITSHCLPDPLLGWTGTEESLNMLQSAAFLSLQRLGKNEAKLLQLISDLTPSRVHTKPRLTVEWNELPILSQHHDFHPAVVPILKHAAALETICDKPVDFRIPDPKESSESSITASLLIRIRTASRNKIYYPRDSQLRHSSVKKEVERLRGQVESLTGSTYLEELECLKRLSLNTEDIVYKSKDAARARGSAELAAYQMSWSIWNDRPYLSRKWRKPWDAMRSWGPIGPAEEGISLRYSRYWIDNQFPLWRDWLKIYDLCQEALNGNSQETRIKLVFSLSAASFKFSRSSHMDLIPLILIFATDTRFRGLKRPPPSRYQLSDGTYPDHERLVKLMSKFALPIERTPAQTMENYDKSISKIASKAAKSTVERWPERWCDLPHQWFDIQGCKKSVEAYLESISRNIGFRGHVLRLQDILSRCTTTNPPKTPYVFSPQFSAAPKRCSAPSLRDVLLVSRADLPLLPLTREHRTSGPAVLPPSLTIVTEGNPPSSKGGDLISLIEELRQASRDSESLLRIYGEDLKKSYDDLMGNRADFLVQPERRIPSQGSLHQYSDLCSKQKDSIFSELSEALGPSQKTDIVLRISGLWPRITPRSILRQLSKDHVSTLTDQWKQATICYAVAFLKYQQSKRLLELSSSNRHEELLRELDALCEPVAMGYSPEWLLIQVSCFSCQLSNI